MMGSSGKAKLNGSGKQKLDSQTPLTLPHDAGLPKNSVPRNTRSSTRLPTSGQTSSSSLDRSEPQHPSLPTQAPKTRRQKVKNKPPQATRVETLSPIKVKEQLVELNIDILRLRARVVHTWGQADATSLWGFSDDLHPSTGFRLCDGFDQTWFVSTGTTSPVPLSKHAFASDVRQRTLELNEIYTKDENKELFDKVTALLEKEVVEKCQDEWDGNRDDPYVPPTEWEHVKKQYDGLKLAQMIATTRLKTGEALLLDHYQVRVIEITTDGIVASQRVVVPFGLSLAAFYKRLDALFPPDSDHDQEVIEILRNKLRVVEKYGNNQGVEKAQTLLKELERPFFVMDGSDSERTAWTSKLLMKDAYKLQPGKNPDRIRGWTLLADDAALRGMEQGKLAGKHPVVVRVRPSPNNSTSSF